MRGHGPAARPRRLRVERASQPALDALSRFPTPVIAAVVGVGVLVALLVQSRWAALALLPGLLFVGWLSYLAWPTLDRGPRLLRMLVLGVLAAWIGGRLLA